MDIKQQIRDLDVDAEYREWIGMAVKVNSEGGPDLRGARIPRIVEDLKAWAGEAPSDKHLWEARDKARERTDEEKRQKQVRKILENEDPAEWKNLYGKISHAFPGEIDKDWQGKDWTWYRANLIQWARKQIEPCEPEEAPEPGSVRAVGSVTLRIGDVKDLISVDAPGMVNRPPHYCHGEIEPIDVIEDWQLDFHLGQVVKYVARAGRKGDRLEDLEKARWYLDRAIGRIK